MKIDSVFALSVYLTYFLTSYLVSLCCAPSGQLLKQLCLEVGRFDVGRNFWVPISGQLRGIPVFQNKRQNNITSITYKYKYVHQNYLGVVFIRIEKKNALKNKTYENKI